MQKLLRINALLKKELLQLLKNPKSRFILFIPVIMQLLIFGYAATMDLKTIDFAVMDHAHSALSRQLVAKFTGNRIFNEKEPLVSVREMRNRIDSRDIRMALIIPENFDASLLSKKGSSEIQIIVDGRNSSSAGIALGYAQSVVELFNQEHNSNSISVKIETRAWFNPNYNVRYFMVPALLALIALLDIMLLTALSIAREREDGTFDQLLLTPFSTGELLGAKAFASIIVGLCQLTCGTLMARLWFQIPFLSSYMVLYVLFLVFLFASVGTGLLISVLCKNLQQALISSFIIATPFAMLSGLATPIKALQRIFLEGATLVDLMHPFAILLAIGISMFSMAYFIFHKQRKC